MCYILAGRKHDGSFDLQKKNIILNNSCELFLKFLMFDQSYDVDDFIMLNACTVFCSQALQHGVRECQGDVDGSSEDRQGQEEVQASEQGPLHLEDVPPWRFGHPRPEEPTSELEDLLSARIPPF